MNKRKCEFLIIGQGIAGTLIASELLDRGKDILVVDPGSANTSSKIAAGVINPITGRRFVKSWRFDEIFAFAKKRYKAISEFLDVDNFITPREIVRVLFNAGEENEWLARTGQDGWKEYVGEAKSLLEFEGHIQNGFSQGLIKGAQVDIARLVKTFREYLASRNLLLSKKISVTEKAILEKQIENIEFENIIFCEGAAGRFNPLWSFVEFEPAKGEVFHVKIDGLRTERLIKHNLMMTPLGEEKYWVGSNYEWNAANDQPSDIGRKFIYKKLEKMLIDFTEINHLAATRPTIKDRRPVLGKHPKYNNCYLFNGLGTKGASLGPLLAHEFCEVIFSDLQLAPEISIKRFYRNLD